MVEYVAIIRTIIYLIIMGFISKLVFDFIVKKKGESRISYDMLKILESGRANAKALDLRYLVLSEDGLKRIVAGKIESFIKVKYMKLNFNCLVVKKNVYSTPRFYLINDADVISNDIDFVSSSWNYRIDENSSFYTTNQDKLILIEAMQDGVGIGVDTLSKLAPLVHSSINANPIHRIRLREQGLMR